MSLYRVGQNYYIDITGPSGRIRRAARTTDKKQAQEYHDRLKAELWRVSQLGERAAVTWGEAVRKWLSIRPRGMPEKYTLRAFSIALSSSLPLDSGLVNTELEPMSAGSFNRALNLINAIHRASNVEPPKVERKPQSKGRTRWLTREEWARLSKALRQLSPLLAQCAEFAVSTGLRENNVLNLEWSQVDLRRRVAWIHADQAKGREPIGIPLNDSAMAVLEERRGEDKKYVFANPDTGLPYYKASSRKWYEAIKKAKLPGVRFHDLRHTFASWAVMGGVRLEELMQLGGWKTYSMVQRYAHLSAGHLAGASAKVKPVSMK